MTEGFERAPEFTWWKPVWVATRDITIKYGDITVDIKKGFKSDGLTRPWFLRPFFRAKKYALAALAHDWLYVHKLFSKVLSDAFFYQILKDSNVIPFIRSSMFALVLLFGGNHWDE